MVILEPGGEPPKRRRSLPRRILRWLLIFVLSVVGLVVLVVGLALLLLQTDWGRAQVLSIALDQVNGAVKGSLSAERLDGNILGHVGLSGVEVRDPDGALVGRVGRVDVDYDLFALIDQVVQVDLVRIEGLDLTVTDAEGRVGVARAFEARTPSPPTPSEPSAWVIRVDRVELTGGSVRQSPLPGAPAVHALEVSTAILVEGGRVSWDELAIAATLENLPVEKIALATTGAFRDGAVDVTHLAIDAGPHALQLHGRVSDFDAPVFALTLERAHADLTALAAAIPGLPLKGEVNLSGSVDGPLRGARLSLELTGSAGRVSIGGTAGLRDIGPVYDLDLRVQGARPSGVLRTFEPPIEADLRLHAQGEGNPMEGGRASARLVLLDLRGTTRLPLPIVVEAAADGGGARLLVKASGEGIEGIDIRASAQKLPPGRVEAAWDIRGIAVAAVAALAGIDGATGRVGALTGSGVVDLGEGGVSHAEAKVNLDGAGIRVPLGEAGLASVGDVALEADLEWGGAGLPTGELHARLRQVGAAGASVAGVRLDLGLEEAGGVVRAKGALSADDAVYEKLARVARLDVPFDLSLPPLDRLPEVPPAGTLTVAATGARVQDMDIGGLKLDAKVSGADGAISVAGPLTVSDFRKGRDASVATLAGQIDVTRTRTGRIDADVTLDAGRVAAAGFSVASVSLRAGATVNLSETLRVTSSGKATVRGLRSGTSLGVKSATADFDLSLRGSVPVGSATVHATEVALPERTLSTVDARVALDSNGEALVDVTASDGTVELEARLSALLPLGRRRELSASIHGLTLSGEGVGVSIPAGASVTVGKDGALSVAGLEINGVGSLQGSITASGTFAPRSKELAANVTVTDVPVGEWVETISKLSGVPILEDTELGGTLSMEVTASGTPSRPVASIAVRMADVRFGPIDNLTTDIRVGVSRGGVKVAGIATWKGESRLALNVDLPITLSLAPVSVEVAKDEPIKLVMQIRNVDLSDFRPFVPAPPSGTPLGGQLDGDVNLTGTVQDPRGKVDITAKEITYGPMSEVTAGLDVSLDAERTHANVSLANAARGELLRLDAEVPANIVSAFAQPHPVEALRSRLRGKPLDLTVALEDLNLAELPFTEGLSEELRAVKVGLDLSLAGTPEAPNLTGELRAASVPVVESTGDVTVSIASSDGDVAANLAVLVDGEQLVEGLVRLPGVAARVARGEDLGAMLRDPRFLATVLVPRLPPATLAKVIPAASRWVGNAVFDPEVTASVVVTGAEAGPSVHARVTAGSVGPKLSPLQQGIARSIQVSAELLPERMHATVVLDQGEDGGFLTVDASSKVGTSRLLAKDGPPLGTEMLEGFVRTQDFDVRGISRLLPSVFGASEGTLAIDLTLAGTFEQPEVTGTLDAKFDRLVLAVLGLVQDDFDVHVALTETGLHLDPIRMEQDGGTFDLTLDVPYERLAPEAMTLDGGVTLNKFRLMDRNDIRAKLSGEVKVAGSLSEPIVSGYIGVDDAKLSPEMGGRNVRPVGPPRDVKFRSARTTPELLAQEEQSQLKSKSVVIDLSLSIPARSVWVKNDMLDLFISGDLNVRSFGPDITVEGMITVVEGTVELYGRKFQITDDSRVVFDGASQVNPRLSVTATYDISEVNLAPIGLEVTSESKIYVEITGTASKPDIKLRSDPPMDDTNIVSIIVLGSPVGGGEQQGTVERQTVNMVVGLATGSLTKLVQSELPIDVFKVEGGEQSLADAQITVGKRLTRDLLLMYHANLGAEEDENENEVRVDYSITPRLHLETRFGDAGQGALDLVFRWRY